MSCPALDRAGRVPGDTPPALGKLLEILARIPGLDPMDFAVISKVVTEMNWPDKSDPFRGGKVWAVQKANAAMAAALNTSHRTLQRRQKRWIRAGVLSKERDDNDYGNQQGHWWVANVDRILQIGSYVKNGLWNTIDVELVRVIRDRSYGSFREEQGPKSRTKREDRGRPPSTPELDELVDAVWQAVLALVPQQVRQRTHVQEKRIRSLARTMELSLEDWRAQLEQVVRALRVAVAVRPAEHLTPAVMRLRAVAAGSRRLWTPKKWTIAVADAASVLEDHEARAALDSVDEHRTFTHVFPGRSELTTELVEELRKRAPHVMKDARIQIRGQGLPDRILFERAHHAELFVEHYAAPIIAARAFVEVTGEPGIFHGHPW